ncbi:MAG: PPC domain-containing protein, partial [Verrucomicrobiota bacterium]
MTFKLTLPEEATPGIGVLRLVSDTGVSSPVLVQIDELPTVEAKSAPRPEAAQHLTLPVVVEGASPGLNVQFFSFEANKGQRLSAEVVAQRIGSKMDPVLTLLDARGKELLDIDDDPSLGADCHFSFTVPEAGTYWLKLQDLEYRGGLRYRLRLGDFPLTSVTYPPGSPSCHEEREPNDGIFGAAEVELPCGVYGRLKQRKDVDAFRFSAPARQWVTIVPKTTSLGSPARLFLRLMDEKGKVLAESGQSDRDEEAIRYRSLKEKVLFLVVEDLLRDGGEEYIYHLQLETGRAPFSLGLNVGRIKQSDRGVTTSPGLTVLPIQATRYGYDGPISLRVSGLEGDFRLEQDRIEKGKSDLDLRLIVPAGLEQNALSFLKLTGEAEIDGLRYAAPLDLTPVFANSFPGVRKLPEALQEGIPLKVIEEPFALTVESVSMKPGESKKIPVQLKRMEDDRGLPKKPVEINVSTVP